MGGVYCLIAECSPEAKDWAALILVALALAGGATWAIIWARGKRG